MPAAPLGQGDRDRGRGHQRQHTGGVGAGLGVDVGLERDGDDRGDDGEDQHQRAGGAGPVRRHPVAGQVAGHDVEQPGHGRGAGEPQDPDGGDVVDGAEPVAEVLVRQVGQRAAVGLAAGLELRRGDEERGDDGRAHQHHAT